MGFISNIVKDVTGAGAAEKAAKLGKSSLDLQRKQYQDLYDYFQKLSGQFTNLKQGGFFDPETRIASFDKDFDKGLNESMAVSATADRIAGDNSGQARKRRDTIAALAQNDRARAHESIRRGAAGEEFDYLTRTRPDMGGATAGFSNALNSQADMYRQQAMAQSGSLMKLFGAFTPFLRGGGGGGGSSWGTPYWSGRPGSFGANPT